MYHHTNATPERQVSQSSQLRGPPGTGARGQNLNLAPGCAGFQKWLARFRALAPLPLIPLLWFLRPKQPHTPPRPPCASLEKKRRTRHRSQSQLRATALARRDQQRQRRGTLRPSVPPWAPPLGTDCMPAVGVGAVDARPVAAGYAAAATKACPGCPTRRCPPTHAGGRGQQPMRSLLVKFGPCSAFPTRLASPTRRANGAFAITNVNTPALRILFPPRFLFFSTAYFGRYASGGTHELWGAAPCRTEILPRVVFPCQALPSADAAPPGLSPTHRRQMRPLSSAWQTAGGSR